MKKLQLSILAAALVGASSASASLITVIIDSPSPEQIVTLQVVNTGSGINNFGPSGVYAGIYNETVDGVYTPSLCIDVAREVSVGDTFNNYYYSTLVSAPLAPSGPMGATHVAAIEKLWAAYYSPASTDVTGLTAAALQVAVWENLGDNTLGYTVTVSGNTAVTTEANIMLASLSGLTAQADLEALVSPTGQNYVVPVPEPTTIIAGAMLLFPFGASTLRMLRRKRTA